MQFSLSLPPLVTLLLLAFFWVILFVLLLWFAFRPRRREEQPIPAQPTSSRPQRARRDPRRKGDDDDLEATPKDRDSVRARSRTPAVRVTEIDRGSQDTDSHDDFDNYNRPNHRRDDFDF